MSINPAVSAAINSAQQFTSSDMQMLASVPAEKRPQAMAQMQMQKESELVTLITNLMKQMHENNMAIIRNTGG